MKTIYKGSECMEGKEGMNGKSIKKILFFKSRIMVYVLIILLIPINFTFYLSSFHKQQKERSEQMFHQIMQVISVKVSTGPAQRKRAHKNVPANRPFCKVKAYSLRAKQQIIPAFQGSV